MVNFKLRAKVSCRTWSARTRNSRYVNTSPDRSPGPAKNLLDLHQAGQCSHLKAFLPHAAKSELVLNVACKHEECPT